MHSPSPPAESRQIEYSPVFLHARKEALIIFSVWVVALLWAVPFCYLNGYPENFDPENFSTVWGIPSWVFWGIAFPWLLANLFTTWFCFFYMADDDLGEAHEGVDIEAEIAEMHADENATGDEQTNREAKA